MAIISNLPSGNSIVLGTGGGSLDFDIPPKESLVLTAKDGGWFNANIAIQGNSGMIYGVYNVCGYAGDQYHIQKIQETGNAAYAIFSLTLQSPNITISNNSSDTAIHVGIQPILGGQNLTVPSIPGAIFGAGIERKSGVIPEGKTLWINNYTDPTDSIYAFEVWLQWANPRPEAALASAVFGHYYYSGIERNYNTMRGYALADTICNVYNSVIMHSFSADHLLGYTAIALDGIAYMINPLIGRLPDSYEIV